jgi:hypothetical protein
MKTNLKNWARSCHYDFLIAVKEVKGKRWMAVLSMIEAKGNFDINDYYPDIDASWKKILETINSMSNEEIKKIDVKRHSL